MRCACIDIGSNTTRLLVAESARDGRLRELHTERAFTRLGSLLGPGGAIPPAVVRVGAEVVAEQVAAARTEGVASIRVVATAAIRDAANRDDFTAAVHELAGLPVEVLSGEDEARLAFLGATGSLAECPDGLLGVVDVGGRSSELVAGTRDEGVAWATSLPVGSGLLADQHLHDDPPTPDAARRGPRARRRRARAAAPAAARRGVRGRRQRDLAASPAGDRARPARRSRAGSSRSPRCPARTSPAGSRCTPSARACCPPRSCSSRAPTGAFGTPLRTCGGGLREGVLLEAIRGSGPSQVAGAAD